MKKLLLAAVPAALTAFGAQAADVASVNTAELAAAPNGSLSINMIGNFRTGVFDESATEIVAYDTASKRLFAVNGYTGTVMVIDLSDPAEPVRIKDIDLAEWGKAANAVAAVNGIVVAAVQGVGKQDPGNAVFFDVNGNYKNHVQVGALPDGIDISPDGKYVVVANEGEPSDDYTNDPEGSISVIDISGGVENPEHTLITFAHMNAKPLPEGLRLGSDRGSFAQNMEPEYVTISEDSATAYVTLQENNAIAIVDLSSASLTSLTGLGYKDHMQHPLDASNKDGGINLKTWPVKGMYQPDSAHAFRVNGQTYVAIANEGDARDYDGYSEETRIAKLTLDPAAFPNAQELQKPENLGRLKTTTANGDVDGDGDFDELYVYGGRSFAILDAAGRMIYDSGAQFEAFTAAHFAENFNATNDENGSFDNRSDDKGPEPEALTVGVIDGNTYVFVGLERFGGFFAYDVSDPAAPVMAAFRNDRDFSGDPKADTAGELAPEGMTFIGAEDSPNGTPLLVVASEVSGSIAVYEVTGN